jgi:hypothetical protein
MCCDILIRSRYMKSWTVWEGLGGQTPILAGTFPKVVVYITMYLHLPTLVGVTFHRTCTLSALTSTRTGLKNCVNNQRSYNVS